jgi:hypothetical protein
MLYFAVGTFIPGPQQELVRNAFSKAWAWLKGLVPQRDPL